MIGLKNELEDIKFDYNKTLESVKIKNAYRVLHLNIILLNNQKLTRKLSLSIVMNQFRFCDVKLVTKCLFKFKLNSIKFSIQKKSKLIQNLI